MEKSILKTVKKMLLVSEDDSSFDGELIPHINEAFSHLNQIGIGTAAPIEGAEAEWESLSLPVAQLNMVKTFVHAKVKMAFDPPTTSFLIDVTQKRIAEQEWRLRTFVEGPESWPIEEVTA